LGFVDGFDSSVGIVAIAAAILALSALVFCLVLARRLRRIREAQSVVLGDENGDIVAHAKRMDDRLTALAGEADASIRALALRDDELADRLDGAVTGCAVVRYDAMGEMTGRQSSSVALLDGMRSGVVLSSILHRDQARLYAKQIVDGQSALDLSPEEEEAIRRAGGTES
jgi:HAMP domain-containing protein